MTDAKAWFRSLHADAHRTKGWVANGIRDPNSPPCQLWMLNGLKQEHWSSLRQTSRLGSMAARLKLKGLSGGLVNWWSMWFNVIVLVQPYLLLNVNLLFVLCCWQVLHVCRQWLSWDRLGSVRQVSQFRCTVLCYLYMLPEKSASRKVRQVLISLMRRATWHLLQWDLQKETLQSCQAFPSFRLLTWKWHHEAEIISNRRWVCGGESTDKPCILCQSVPKFQLQLKVCPQFLWYAMWIGRCSTGNLGQVLTK